MSSDDFSTCGFHVKVDTSHFISSCSFKLLSDSRAFILHSPIDLGHCSSLLLVLSPVQRNSGLFIISFSHGNVYSSALRNRWWHCKYYHHNSTLHCSILAQSGMRHIVCDPWGLQKPENIYLNCLNSSYSISSGSFHSTRLVLLYLICCNLWGWVNKEHTILVWTVFHSDFGLPDPSLGLIMTPILLFFYVIFIIKVSKLILKKILYKLRSFFLSMNTSVQWRERKDCPRKENCMIFHCCLEI